jgi:hypothetical protein
MHRLTVLRAAQVRQSRAGNEASRRLFRMIDRHHQFPLRLAAVNFVVGKQRRAGRFSRKIGQLRAIANRRLRQCIQRGHSVEQTQLRLLDNRHSPLSTVS